MTGARAPGRVPRYGALTGLLDGSASSTLDCSIDTPSGWGNGQTAPVANQVQATLVAGPDGALWVTVDGVDVEQLAASISAVCDVLTRLPSSRE
ncbi:hypothetical protein [Amycolatopsis sp. NPDC001319]|uniref:hypothetical protein n=1 Tax=unclassified Amycolatopsis TaxID=2618356 RepID=UPI003689BD12